MEAPGRASLVVLYLLVGLGSAIGGLARIGLSLAGRDVLGLSPALSLLPVNASGSLLIGLIAAMLPHDQGTRRYALLVPGLLAGYTSFSVFSVEAMSLLQAGHWVPGAAYVAFSALTWLGAVALGFTLGRWIRRRRRA